ncbi:MAG: hypothetical protein ACUVRX_11025 [Actinomycetota bacterium]
MSARVFGEGGRLLETGVNPEERARRIGRAGNAMKLGFAVLLSILAGLVAFFQLFRTPAPQRPLEEAVRKLEEGDIEGAMAHVDPEGQLGILWSQNTGGIRNRLSELATKYRLEFSSLGWRTRTEGDYAESSLVKGRMTVYLRGREGPPLAVYDLRDSGLVLYLQRKDGTWLIEGLNYDLEEILGEGLGDIL